MTDIVVWWGALSTTALATISFFVLFYSLRQNKNSIDLLKENLEVNKRSMELDRQSLEEYKRTSERQAFEKRPKFREVSNAYPFNVFQMQPTLYLENIGGMPAIIKTAHMIVALNTITMVKDLMIEKKKVNPGAPLRLEMDFPVTIMDYHVERRDGLPLKNGELEFLSVGAILEYTHLDDEEDAHPFTDNIHLKIGNDFYRSGDYYLMPSARISTEKDTWETIFSSFIEMNSEGE